MRLAHIYKKTTKYRSIIALAICVLTLLYFSLSVFGSSSGGVFWKYDDAEHLSVATNFIHGKGLTISYIPGGDLISPEYHIRELQIYNEISNPLQDKGPIYMILLGPWLWLTSSTPSNWIMSGTIFNTMLSICLLCVYYYWVKRSFGFGVAFCSTLLLASLSFIFWPASRIIAEPLLGIFFVSAFYFKKSEMEKRDIIILGVLVGLGHLTHGMGIVMGISILLFLLMKRNVRKAVLFVFTWVIILSPWLLRNYLLFGDPTLGLAIPFSSFLKSVIGSSIKAPYGAIAGGWQTAFGTGPLPRLISPFELLSSFFSKLDFIYGMGLVTMSILGLALTGFVVWIMLFKRNRIHTQPLGHTSNKGDMKLRSDMYLMAVIFCGVALAAYYYLATLLGGSTPEPRFLLPILYFLIPISFIGVEDILRWIHEKTRIVRNLNWLVFVIVFLLFITLFVPGSLISVARINDVQKFTWETHDQEILHSWIRENIPDGANIASNEPTGLYLRTGLSIIPLKLELFNSNTTYLRWIREKFLIDYIVLYNCKFDVMCMYLGNNTYLFQVCTVGENTVYQYFHGLPYLELNPTVIFDGNETDLSLVLFGSGSYNWSLSEENVEKVIGSSSARITRSPGTQSCFAVDRTFAAVQDWTNKTVFCIWIYGNNSGGIQRYSIAAPDWSNYFWYTCKDDFTGWRLIVVPLKNFEIIGGTPNWSTVKTVRILDGGIGSLYYIGRTTVDSGIIANNDKK